MSADKTGCILIVEDEETVRKWVRDVLEGRGYRQFLEAEHIEQARSLMKEHWDKIVLIVMDVMLPENESDAIKIQELMEQREPAYDRWLRLEDEGKYKTDPDWLKARFDVDLYDRKIFEILNVEGGVQLIEEWGKEFGKDGKLDKPVLYLTARENEAVTKKGISLVVGGKAEWRVKPVTSEQLISGTKKILLVE